MHEQFPHMPLAAFIMWIICHLNSSEIDFFSELTKTIHVKNVTTKFMYERLVKKVVIV